MFKRQSRDLPFVKHLNISITLSPYLSVDSLQFQTFIQDRMQDYWVSLPTGPQAQLVHIYLFCMSLIYKLIQSYGCYLSIACHPHCLCLLIGSIFNTLERKILCQAEHL